MRPEGRALGTRLPLGTAGLILRLLVGQRLLVSLEWRLPAPQTGGW